MSASGPRPGRVAVQISLAAIFVSLELSRSTWLITSLVPGGGDKMSKHSVRNGDIAGLLNHLTVVSRERHSCFASIRRSGSTVGLAQVQEIWIVAEALERFVERHGACAEVAERAPATAVRGVEQHDLVAVAGQA